MIEGHALKPLIFIARSPETSQPDGDRIDKDVFFLGTWETTAAAIAVRSGTVAKRYLSLDQAMIMGAIGNDLARDMLKRAFVTPQFERVVRPLLAAETSNVPAGQPLPQLGGAAGR